ncbi:putative alkaline/neutral invertase B [Forsythia ovata]|uniref:Alkaline/neutral invertase n=1 Tax=Forsythia ovata TaxID=205694 RepID=A0ABD1RZG1_9LAMI
MSISSPPRQFYRNSENSSRVFDNFGSLYSSAMSGVSTPRSISCVEAHPIVAEAWVALQRSTVHFRGQPVGTIAALDHSSGELNYDQVFVRDFVPSAPAFLMNGEPEIVKNFLLKTLRLQSWEKKILGNVLLVEWLLLIRVFGGLFCCVHILSLQGTLLWLNCPNGQMGIRLILTLCLSEAFDTFPTLLCADGCCMIDRRMGVYEYPIEIQALFFMALRCALYLLKNDDEGKECADRISKRLHALKLSHAKFFLARH